MQIIDEAGEVDFTQLDGITIVSKDLRDVLDYARARGFHIKRVGVDSEKWPEGMWPTPEKLLGVDLR